MNRFAVSPLTRMFRGAPMVNTSHSPQEDSATRATIIDASCGAFTEKFNERQVNVNEMLPSKHSGNVWRSVSPSVRPEKG
jgi:hypothetical protein